LHPRKLPALDAARAAARIRRGRLQTALIVNSGHLQGRL
jgi:hypothetical protein